MTDRTGPRSPGSRVKVLSVFGTRPDTIKMAPVVRALAEQHDWCDQRVAVTAQHRDLVDPLLAHFEIHADYDLGVMRQNQSLNDLTARLFAALGDVLAAERPHWLLVQGDTTTSLVAGMSAFYHGVSVGHVEAGLRTADKRSPFPEEMNRRLLGQLADLHFAPTARAEASLVAEGVPADRIAVTGNTAIDALRWTAARVSTAGGADSHDDWAALLPPTPARRVLVTTHRRESFGPPLEATCRALDRIAREYGDRIEIVLPVHPNPNVRDRVYRLLDGRPNIRLLPPLSYPALVFVLSRAYLVITDSGGIQEEAPSLGKPVLVLRENTERPEGVEAGVSRLVGTNEETIVGAVRALLDDERAYAQMARPTDLYGDGHAAARIVQVLKARATSRNQP